MQTPTSEFDIPAAPILIPEGPWVEVEGSVNAASGFKAQGIYTSEDEQSCHCNVFVIHCTLYSAPALHGTVWGTEAGIEAWATWSSVP